MSQRALPVALAIIAAAVLAHTEPARTQEVVPRIAGDTNTLATKGLLATTDEDFIKHAVRSGVIKMQAARLAMTKSANAAVKAYAEKLVADHTAIARDLAQWATKKNVVLKDDDPALKMKLDKHKSLETKTGGDFDRAFLDAMLDDHMDAIILFSNEALRTSDAALKTFAEESRATIRALQKMARGVRAKL